MAEGDADRPDDAGKNGPANASNGAENGIEDEPNFSDEEGFVDTVSDAGK
jgi:hypothetical protein